MGGEAKRRGTREERVAKAIARKNQEKGKDYDYEIMWCYHQRDFENNFHEFKDLVLMRIQEDNEKLFSILKRGFKEMYVGQSIRSTYKDYEAYPFISTTIKKQSKIVCKVIFETIYGICYICLSPNGTANWHITENSHPEIIDSCYKRIIMIEYINKQINKELSENNF